MDITQTLAVNKGTLSSFAAANTVKREPPQAPAAAAPVVPNNAARASAVEAAKPAAINEAELKRSIDAINKFLQPVSGDIQFSQDEETGRTVVKVVDMKSNTVLRQIPSKEVLAIASELDKLQGLLVRDKV